MNMSKELHDQLLANKPATAVHEAAGCIYCTEQASHQEEKVEDKIFSQEQLDTLIASAVESANAKFVTENEETLLTLRTELEDSQAATVKALEEVKAGKDLIAERDETARLKTLGEDRVKKVKEVASFTDEELEARRERYAKMSDEEFDLQLADYKAIIEAASASGTGDAKKLKTSFSGNRETAGEEGEEKSVLAKFFPQVSVTTI